MACTSLISLSLPVCPPVVQIPDLLSPPWHSVLPGLGSLWTAFPAQNTHLEHRTRNPIPIIRQALDNAGLEFERDYLPDLQRRVAEAKARQEAAKQVRSIDVHIIPTDDNTQDERFLYYGRPAGASGGAALR